ncbi:MAG: hypothetical protein ACXWNE_07320, partial [Candidatus Binataceae bacterium]
VYLRRRPNPCADLSAALQNIWALAAYDQTGACSPMHKKLARLHAADAVPVCPSPNSHGKVRALAVKNARSKTRIDC